jgi:predicted nucleic acid-binding protein
MIKTYLDTNALIAAFRSDHPAAVAAMSVLGDPERAFMAGLHVISLHP